MPLDPHIRRFLDMMALGRTADPDLAARREGLRNLARLAACEIEGIGARDLTLPGAAGRLAARLYEPREAGRGPGLVFFHGGGLVTGDLDTHDGICRTLAEGGLRVLSVAYRLAPEHPFPAALDDALAATAWAAEHAPALGIDPGRLAVGGDSAGAGLAASACQEMRGEMRGGPAIAGQLLICPVLDALGTSPSRRDHASGFFLEAGTIRRDAETCGLAAGAPRVSPLRTGDLRGLPPAHIHTAEFDPVRDDGFAYAGKLRRAGVSVRHECHPGMIHFFYGLGRLVPRSRPILRAIAADFAGQLAGSRIAA